MKCRLEKSFGIYDAGPDALLKLKPLMIGFQDVVAEHSKVTGCGLEWLLEQNRAWVMHRMVLHIHRMPRMGEGLTFVTWHKGAKGYKAYRDYEVWSEEEKIVTAASLWLFIDLEKGKLLKVPKESSQWYAVQEGDAISQSGIDDFKPVPRSACDTVDKVSVRSSDFDPIGHVNNAVYLDFLETAVDRHFGGKQKISSVMIQFHKEISRETAAIRVGLEKGPEENNFTLSSDAAVHAFGYLKTKKG